MVFSSSQTAIHEATTLVYMSFLMCVGQLILRMISINGISTTLLLLSILLYISYRYADEPLSLQSVANSGIRLLADVLGFLVGVLVFSLLISSSGAKLAFTPDNLLDIVTGAGLTLGGIFLSIVLTYFSSLSLISIARFIINLIMIPINLISGLLGGGGSSGSGGSGASETPARRRYNRRRR